MVPAAIALFAAALFGLVVHVQRRGLDGTDGLTGTFISVVVMSAIYWLMSPLYMEWGWWTSQAAILFALCGLMMPAFSARMQIASVGAVGPALTSAIASFAPAFAVLPAVFVLGESFGLRPTAGLCLMILGLTLAAIGRNGVSRDWPLWALALPLGAAFLRGILLPVMKVGFAEVPSPLFASLVMSSVSVVVLGVMIVTSGRSPEVLRGGNGHLWFALGGLIIAGGLLALNTAISLGDVVIAAPLAATTPLWALLYGALIFRRESLGPRHLLIASMVVAGAILIVTR